MKSENFFKKITGNSVTLTKDGEVHVLVQSTSRVRSWVQAHQWFKISEIKEDPFSIEKGSDARTVDAAIKKFIEQGRQKAKKPQNLTRKKD